MGNAFGCILNRMRKVIERVDAPFIALAVMLFVEDAVNRRVAEVHVRAGHIDFGTKRLCAVRELAVFHAFEQVQIFFDAPVPIRALFARLRQRAAVFAHFVCRQVADIGKPLFDEVHRDFVAFVKVIRAVENAVRFGAEPADIFIDGADIFVILADRVCIVVAEVEFAAVFFRGAVIDPDGLGAADVQIAVRFGWEACVYMVFATGSQVRVNDFVDKVRSSIRFHRISPFLYESWLTGVQWCARSPECA